MDTDNEESGAKGRLLFIAFAAILFGSTMILSAAGPAKASEAAVLTCGDGPLILRYLA
ncbi:hypothetical protein L288_04455 [Sphingobium quisquiliarum P25]|uniref:Uncharacterized protein n=1 Tax=Sphingobium quisquiliarum P25 TaxID=1329909 RepID=T0H1G0_9SPHN|nr:MULTISPECIES: hypothetical protein [Sphingobium]EQB10196.1 hypothetical protein L288_04455 [Sphingobium quisquiliarum P25]